MRVAPGVAPSCLERMPKRFAYSLPSWTRGFDSHHPLYSKKPLRAFVLVLLRDFFYVMKSNNTEFLKAKTANYRHFSVAPSVAPSGS